MTDALGRDARSPSEIPRRGWREVVVQSCRGVSDNSLAALAAATAFYGFLAIPSGLTAVIAGFGLAYEEGSVERLLGLLRGHASPELLDIVGEQFRMVIAQPRGMLIGTLVIGLAIAVWSALSAARTTMTALNAAYKERETRSLLRYCAVLTAVAAAALVLALAALALIVLLPIVIEWLPVGTAALGIAVALRWPALAILFGFGLALLYRWAPSRAVPRWRWVGWGSVAAVAVWLIASAVMSYYAAHFGSYERIYGAFAGVALLMLWLYSTAFAVMLGAQINAQLEQHVTTETMEGKGPEDPGGGSGAAVADRSAGDR